jgi:hypothetical protein
VPVNWSPHSIDNEQGIYDLLFFGDTPFVGTVRVLVDEWERVAP